MVYYKLVLFILCFSFQGMASLHWDEIEGVENQRVARLSDEALIRDFSRDFENERASILKWAESIYARHLTIISVGNEGDNYELAELDRDAWLELQERIARGVITPKTVLGAFKVDPIYFKDGVPGVVGNSLSVVAASLKFFKFW